MGGGLFVEYLTLGLLGARMLPACAYVSGEQVTAEGKDGAGGGS